MCVCVCVCVCMGGWVGRCVCGCVFQNNAQVKKLCVLVYVYL